jgi:hypothetical protein
MPYLALKSEKELRDFTSDSTSDSAIIIVGKVLENVVDMRINFIFDNEFDITIPYRVGYCEYDERKCFHLSYNFV